MMNDMLRLRLAVFSEDDPELVVENDGEQEVSG